MDYAGLAEAAAAKMELYRRDADGWRSCRHTGEVAVSWKPSAEFAGNMYRAEGTVPSSPLHVWECIKPVAGGLRTKWDQSVKDFEVVEAVSDVSASRAPSAVSVCRTTTPSALMKIISPREFVDVVLMRQFEDGTMLSAGKTLTEPDRTQLLSFFQTDLGGYLPQTVVDSFIPASIAGFYSNLSKAVKALKA
ncbi:UNVERIFIED_CONTAM: hypothetical protein H355_007628 [Colinus virginianus]|nr:hypothetical protein H355_007628 [Colinus virginianus]